MDTNLGYLTLEGSECQTLDTRSTSVVPLKSYKYGSANGLCGRSVASKLSAHRPSTKIGEKVIFLVFRTLFYYSVTTLKFWGFWFWTGTISWNLVLRDGLGNFDCLAWELQRVGTLNWVQLMTKHLKLERLLKEGIANWLCPVEIGICGRIAVWYNLIWLVRKKWF